MKAVVDKDVCVGCGICAENCPEVFFMDDAGKAEAKPGEVPKALEASCRQAISDCPVEAIKEV